MRRIALLISLGVSLAATLVIELAAALLFRKRGLALAVVAAVNLLTNPLLVLIWQLFHAAWLFWLLELAAAAAEGLCYRLFPQEFPRPFCFSVLCNTVSCTIGIMLNGGIG